MRKILTTIALLTGLVMYSQTTQYVNSEIRELNHGGCSVNNLTYHRGDTLVIGLRITSYVQSPPNPFNPTGISSITYLPPSGSNVIIFQGVYNDFQNLPYYTTTCFTGNMYYVTYIIPTNSPLGLSTISGSSTFVKINIVDITTNVEELSKDNVISVKYYNLNGVEISDVKENTLYIRKTEYSNGFVKSDKLFIPQ